MEGPSLIRTLARRGLGPASMCLAAAPSTLLAPGLSPSLRALGQGSFGASPRGLSSSASNSLTLTHHGIRSRSFERIDLRATPPIHSRRTLSTSPHRSASSASNSSSSDSSPSVLAAYQGPLHATFRRLKAFSLLSFALAGLITPVLLFGPGEVAMSGRIALSLTALMTSGVSTALIAWVGGPYVQRMRLLSPIPSSSPSSSSFKKETTPMMEMTTLDWLMRERITEVHDPSIIKPTSRPFATWELDEAFEHVGGQPGEERLVARTRDAKGSELGRWVVSFEGEGEGAADRWTRQEGSAQAFQRVGKLNKTGKVHKHFQVHEETLGDEWRVV